MPKDRIRERVVEAQAGVATDEIPKGLVLINSIWCKGEAVWVSKLVREGVLKEYHDSALLGHPGTWKTVKLIRREYWWPRIDRNVRSYIAGCDKY